MPDAATLSDNTAVTARLQALVARLSDADLTCDLGGGWTVAVALSHLAFWDRRIAYMLERWMRDGTPHVELDDDVVNNALEAVHQAVEPRAAARLAVESAKAADAAIARTPDAISDLLIAEDHAYLLRRTGHRAEHIEQIEAALRS
jgi:DinB superfamily